MTYATPLDLLELLIDSLKQHHGHWAVAGGVAASIYRRIPRLTNDIDVALDLGDTETTKARAEEIVQGLGYRPALGWIAAPKYRLGKSAALVIGRKDRETEGGSIDFLLPVFPWLPKAVSRAQHNKIDYGPEKLPTLTPEDVIIAKCFALSIEPNRFQDLDDIQSIFQQQNDLDLAYLVAEFERLHLSLPKSLRAIAPRALRRANKDK